jgi:sugar lactone lactonase YvrE
MEWLSINLGTLYVVDCSNHRVMRWLKGATQGSVIVGGNGQGGGPSQFYSPVGLSFDRQGNLYVVDYYNHRLQKFIIDPSSNT